MKNSRKLVFVVAAVAVMSLLTIGCGADDKKSSKNGDLFAEVIDSVASAVSEGIAESTANFASFKKETSQGIGSKFGIGEIVMFQNKLYTTSQGGLIVYDFDTKKNCVIQSEESFEALTVHDGSVYAGGSSLYKVVGEELEKQPDQFEGSITELCSYGYRLMVGTDNGLYSVGIFGKESLMSDFPVSAMVPENEALWIGTDGAGLWRWNGEEFQKRHLRRDTTLFDTILSLDFQHNLLYAGSVNGLHIYNGGSWKTYDETSGLTSNNILDIDASGWTAYIVTDAGLFSLYNDDLQEVENLEGYDVNSVKVRGTRVIMGTETGGIISKRGKSINVLVSPDQDDKPEILTSAN